MERIVKDEYNIHRAIWAGISSRVVNLKFEDVKLELVNKSKLVENRLKHLDVLENQNDI